MIDFNHFEKRFGSHVAVDDLSLEVSLGEVVVLLGPNGSGKSTSLKGAAGLLRPTGGHVSIDGEVVGAGRASGRRLVTYMPQRLSFDDHMLVGEIVRLYAVLREVSMARMTDACASYGLQDSFRRPAGELSGGQIQRLGLAVATVGQSPVWLLDEPTAGLDGEASGILRKSIAAHRASGGAVLISTHLLEDVSRLADRVAIMGRGQLLAIRDSEEMRTAIMSATTLDIELLNSDPRFAQIARSAGGEVLEASNGTLRVSAVPADRLGVLRALEQAGAQFARFGESEPSVDEVVSWWTGGNPQDD